jgi:hypothetical protein
MSEKLQQDHYKIKPINHAEAKVSPLGKDLEGASYHAGRGAQFNTKNKFLKDEITKEKKHYRHNTLKHFQKQL